MKTTKKLFVALLAIAMLFALAACSPKKTCTVTFYNGTEVYKTVEVNKGETITMPKAPKGELGKGLRGWSTIDGDMEEIIDPATYVVEADVSLYAIWADVYTVVINYDNGTPFIVDEVFAGTIIEKPADPVKEGYMFIEWRDAIAEVPFDFTQPIHSDVTIKALYADGSPNRVSETKWDFTLGHGAWYGGQSAWKKDVDGISAEDMVYTTTEDGYAAWGFTLTDSLDNIPVIDGNNGKGFGMKFLYNEGISVDANKAKLVVAYIKPKYFPMDMYGNMNDQFRICILTSNGGMIYGYGAGFEVWGAHSGGLNKELIQADIMEDGWIRVQFKIHELDVWSEDAVIKGMSIAIVQRPGNPVMDIISVKSIELLDQEEFIDPHTIEYVTKNEWDMTKEEDVKDWTGAMQNGSNTTSVTTTITENGTSYVYGNTNQWRAIMLDGAKIDISKCSGIFSATVDISGMSPIQYRLYIVTDKGGDPTKNKDRDDVSCYYVTTDPTELTEGWTITPNADGTVTITYDLTKLEYWNGATELQALTFVTVDATTDGTAVYKSISLVDTVKTHNCETDGHVWKDATCVDPKTCAICGATEGEPGEGHDWKDATCTAPKTCSVCGETEGEALGHTWVGATCTSRTTCSVCNVIKGVRLEHNYVDGVCSVCGLELVTEFTQNSWNMSDAEHSKYWTSKQDEKLGDVSSTTVSEAGTVADYTHENGWKGLYLDNAKVDISKLTGKLTFTYSTELNVTAYRIHIKTNKGGGLLSSAAKDANYYITIAVSGIAASDAWTQTVNEDGTVTVTFDLNTLPYFADGTILNGLTIVTVTEKKIGTVTYKSIELEEKVTKVWDMTKEADASEWYCAQAYTEVRESRTYSEMTDTGFKANYGHKNGWKGIILKDVEYDITKLSGLLSFTYYTEDLDITNYRVHVLTDKGGDLLSNTSGNPSDYYVAIAVDDVDGSEVWTRTVNADGSITVTFDLTTLPAFAEGTVLNGMDIVTVDETVTGEWHSITYSNITIS